MNITIGSDPEFFVRKGRHFISGHVFDCGTKHTPKQTEYGHVQVDGIALECNVKPATTKEDFIHNLRGVMADLEYIVHRQHSDGVLVARPSIFFGRRRLAELPAVNSDLGCTPDFNAWTGKMNPRPNKDLPIRTGSGHLHIGWTQDENPRNIKHMLQCAGIVRQLDYYLGLPSLLWDPDHRRRSLYGKAGAYRPTSYGVEYRVLSNAWITTDKHIGWVFDRAKKGVLDYFSNNRLEDHYHGIAPAVINTNKTDWNKVHPDLAKQVLVS